MKKIVIFNILPLFMFLFLMNNLSATRANSDLFSEIIKDTNSQVVEYGIKVVFTTNKNGELVSDNILKDLDFYNGWNITTLKNDKIYSVEFSRDNISGYIETMKYENYNIVSVNIVKQDNKNSLEELRNKLQKYIGDEYSNIRYYQYIKCKIHSGDIYTINEQILKLLKDNSASNISTIELENGYSTTAYTKQYNSIRNNDKLIDFNYSVCKYSSGNYIIIATPEIVVTY